MKRHFFLAFLLALFLIPHSAPAQTLNDLVQAWLAQQGITAASGSYRTCDPGTGDQLCAWNTALLGAQPTAAQLQALASTVAAQQAAAVNIASALAAGVQISSTSTSALNGTYAIDRLHQQLITSEQVYIATTGHFTNGQATRAWLDMNGARHTFPSTAEFTAFAEAVAQYVNALMAGQSPAQFVTIP